MIDDPCSKIWVSLHFSPLRQGRWSANDHLASERLRNLRGTTTMAHPIRTPLIGGTSRFNPLISAYNWGELTHLWSVGWTTKYYHGIKKHSTNSESAYEHSHESLQEHYPSRPSLPSLRKLLQPTTVALPKLHTQSSKSGLLNSCPTKWLHSNSAKKINIIFDFRPQLFF